MLTSLKNSLSSYFSTSKPPRPPKRSSPGKCEPRAVLIWKQSQTNMHNTKCNDTVTMSIISGIYAQPVCLKWCDLCTGTNFNKWPHTSSSFCKENFKVTPCLIFAGFFWVEGEGVCKVLGCKGLCNRWSYFPLRTAKRLGSLSETQERKKTQRAHSPSVAFPIISHTYTHTQGASYIYTPFSIAYPLASLKSSTMYHLISFRFVPLLLPFFFTGENH